VNGAGVGTSSASESSSSRYTSGIILQQKRTFCSSSALSHQHVWIKVVPLQICGVDRSRYITTYGFFDKGAVTTLCSQDLVDILGFER